MVGSRIHSSGGHNITLNTEKTLEQFTYVGQFLSLSIILAVDIISAVCSIRPSDYPNLVWASTQKLYMIAVSHFQGRSILHGSCGLWGYFDHLTFGLETMTFCLKYLFRPVLRHYKCQLLHIFRNLCTVKSFSSFDICPWRQVMTFDWNLFVQILSRPVLRNCAWQLFHIFRAHESCKWITL